MAEDPHSQKMFAYLNLETGEVQRRQEKKMQAVYRAWVASSADGETVSCETLTGWHNDLLGGAKPRLFNRLESQRSMG